MPLANSDRIQLREVTRRAVDASDYGLRDGLQLARRLDLRGLSYLEGVVELAN